MALRKILLLVTGFSLLGAATLPMEAKAAKKPSKGNHKKGAAPTASSLVGDMQVAVIYIVKNAKNIDPKTKQARPFWVSLQTTIQGLDQMEAGIKAKDADMLKGLEKIGRGITELTATWGIVRGAYPKSSVGRGVVALSSAYDMYVNHYGPAAARYKSGGKKLTEAEIAMIDKCDEQLQSILPHLEKVAAKAKPKSYQERMIADLVMLLEKLDAVEGNDARAFAKFMYQWNRLEYALAAYSHIIQVYYPDYYVTWKIMDQDTQRMSTVFGVECWSYYETWDYTTTSITQYEDYYEETAIVTMVTETEESQYEETLISYSEESATEESEEEEEQIDEEVEVDENESDSLFEEVEEDEDDADGDGVSDEEDTDDDNDGTSDEEDADDDGDGLDDEADADEEEEEEMEEDDDDGIAEEDEGDDEE